MSDLNFKPLHIHIEETDGHFVATCAALPEVSMSAGDRTVVYRRMRAACLRALADRIEKDQALPFGLRIFDMGKSK